MPKPFYLHVGLQRCASTLIENVFFKPGHDVFDALRANGIQPLFELFLLLRDHAEDQYWTADAVDRLRAAEFHPLLANSDAAGFFLSDESLSLTCREHGPGIDVEARAHHLARLLDGFEARIILIVRDQASFIRSLYALHLQNLGAKDRDAFVADIPEDALDWRRLAMLYADVFGHDRVVVLPYNAGCYGADAPFEDFMPAMQTSVGIPFPVPVPRTQLYNPSLMGEYFDVQRAANQALPIDIATELSQLLRAAREKAKPEAVIRVFRDKYGTDVGDALREIYAAASFDRDGGFTEDAQRANLARFGAANRALFRDFMPDFDPAPFLAG
ncbi:MAG: hypothetical protein VW268_03820 [Rhodospirillaceae bacterium]